MKSLFKRPKRAKRVCRVENLGSEKQAVLNVRGRENVVCLCMANRNLEMSVYPDGPSAMYQINKYKLMHSDK